MYPQRAARPDGRVPTDPIERALAVRDLTDPTAGCHAMQLLLERLEAALRAAWGAEVRTIRRHPVVTVAENYDRLHYPAEAVTRDARYTRYIRRDRLLRTHTTAMVPPALEELASEPLPAGDVALLAPGLVYRRDVIDRLHTGTPHQVDVWRIRRGPPLSTADLRSMVALVVRTLLPGREHRVVDVTHPYTLAGLQVDVRDRDGWVEIGECGLALPALLREAGLSGHRWSGLAMGLGLDRVLMLAKGIDDIRLLRSEDPRIADQMRDLSPYRPVSNQPPVKRDLSVAVAAASTAEELGDRVREAMGDSIDALESVDVLEETPLSALPRAARERIGIRPGQKNVLLRLVIRHPSRTLTASEANRIRDAVYAAVHEGSRSQWAARPA